MINKIYLPPLEEVKVESLRDLIKSLYTNPDDPSVFRSAARATFHDVEFKNLQCLPAKRSFEDLLCLARTYFPETTEKELMAVLKELKIGCWYCPDVHKIVFFNATATCYTLSYRLAYEVENGENYPTLRQYASDTPTAKYLLEVYNQL